MAYTRYRFIIKNLQGGVSHTNVGIAEIELKTVEGGVDETSNTGGAATAHANIGTSFIAAKAVDDNAATLWDAPSSSTLLSTDGVWWEFEFVSPLDIIQYTVQARASFLNDTPTEWQLCGWNGSSWDLIDTQVVGAWGGGELRTYTIVGGIVPVRVTRLAVEVLTSDNGTPVVETRTSRVISVNYIYIGT